MLDEDQRGRFEALASEVYEPLQRYLRRRCPLDDVDEVFNDVLFVIWRHLDDAPPVEPLPWCYGIARRCVANHRRSIGRRLKLVQRVGASSVVHDQHWIPEADDALHDALDRLGDVDREVIRLWAWERLEPREIAEVLGTTANAISVRLTRVRRQIESELTRQNRARAGHKRLEGHQEVNP